MELYLNLRKQMIETFRIKVLKSRFELCEETYYDIEDYNEVDAALYLVIMALYQPDFECWNYDNEFLDHAVLLFAQAGTTGMLLALIAATEHPIYLHNDSIHCLIDRWIVNCKSCIERNGYQGFIITEELMNVYRDFNNKECYRL